jgi:predicted HTH transcriptional regulator
MDLPALRQLVRQGEGPTLEFKRKAAHPDKIMREVVAFANTRGGTLLVGVDDNGDIPGVKFPEEEWFVLEKALEKYCHPAIVFQHETIKVADNRWVVKVEVIESAHKPVFFLEAGNPETRKVYVRAEDRSIQASKAMREILKRYHPQKNIRFQYGEKEAKLMHYLDLHSWITLREFVQLAGIKPLVALRTLVILVLANVLEIVPGEKEDRFHLKTLPPES